MKVKRYRVDVIDRVPGQPETLTMSRTLNQTSAEMAEYLIRREVVMTPYRSVIATEIPRERR